MVLSFVKDHKKVTNSQVQELLNIDKYKASRLLKKMVDTGKLRKEGSKKGTIYLQCN
jgi:predicted HTH transcriptional regulator